MKKTQNWVRFLATLGLLFAFAAMMIAFTAISMDLNNMSLIIIGWLIAAPLFAFGIGVVWTFKVMLVNEAIHSVSLEKRKRERIDNVLRDLSDEDLMRLKQRLMDGSVDDDLLEAQIIGDDGELIVMEQNS